MWREVPAQIGPCAFGELGRMVTVRSRDLAPLLGATRLLRDGI